MTEINRFVNRVTDHDANRSPALARPFVAAGREDVLAFVPIALGFVPENSLVLLTWGRTRFQARVDLPEDPRHFDAAVASLVGPCLRHEVTEAMVVVFAERRRAERWVDAIVEGFAAAEIALVDLFGADGSCWFALGEDGEPSPGEPYDLRSHPFSARAVVEGRVLLPSRAELAATVSVDEVGRARIASILREITMPVCAETWLSEHLALLCADPDSASGELLSRVIWCLQDTAARDLIWSSLTRANAELFLRLLVRVLKVAPEAYAAHPAALAGFAAWLSGNGALAWCAVERCREIEPDHLMATGLCVLLECGTSPDEWDRLSAVASGVPAPR